MSVDNGVTYRLRAVVVHRGTQNAGHYVAYVNAHDQEWYYCDDAQMPAKSQDRDIVTQQAYMLSLIHI